MRQVIIYHCLWYAVATLLLGACTTTPDPIGNAPPGPPPAVVRQTPQAHQGQRVRWGGTIAAVENTADATRVFVVARDLAKNGRPRDVDGGGGRFIVMLSGFQDPVIYADGREITVVGELQGVQTHRVGGFEYPYPVVIADFHKLWPKRSERYYAYPYYPWF